MTVPLHSDQLLKPCNKLNLDNKATWFYGRMAEIFCNRATSVLGSLFMGPIGGPILTRFHCTAFTITVVSPCTQLHILKHCIFCVRYNPMSGELKISKSTSEASLQTLYVLQYAIYTSLTLFSLC